MEFKISGVLYEKFDPIQRSPTFKVREFVLEKSDEINGRTILNYIKFQCTQERIDILDKVNPGDKITVSFNVRGSKWEKNGQVSYFNNLDAWKIEKENIDDANKESLKEPPTAYSVDSQADDDNDLPF